MQFIYVYRRRAQPEAKRNRRAIRRAILRTQARRFKYDPARIGLIANVRP